MGKYSNLILTQNTIIQKSNIKNQQQLLKDIRYLNPIVCNPEDSRSMCPIFRVITKKNKNMNKSYILKVSYLPTKYGCKKDNSFLVERDIYKNYTNKLILDKNTPNIAAFYFSLIMKNNFYKKIPPDCKEIYMRFAYNNIFDESEDKKIFDYKNLNVIAIEDLKGKDLTEWLTDTKYEKIKSVLFQVIFTLECMNYYGIRHNDIHDKNIFITSNNNPKYLYYITYYNEINKEIRGFKINTYNCLAKIYDFDNSCVVKEKKVINTRILNMKKYGMTHRFNPKFDTFTFLGYLLYEFISQTMEFQDILEIEKGFLSLPFEIIKKVYEKTIRKDLLDESSVLFNDLKVAFKLYDLIQKFIPNWDLFNAEWRLPYRMGKIRKVGYFDNNLQNDNLPDLIPSDLDMLPNLDILHSQSFNGWKIKNSDIKDINSETLFILPNFNQFRDNIIENFKNNNLKLI